MKTVLCPKIPHCYDGKAPYKLPGECCEGCDYLKALRFQSQALPNDVLRPSILTRNRTSSLPRDEVDEEPPLQPEPNTWGQWSPWTDCSRSCGRGRQSRMRECKLEGKAIIDCTGNRVEVRTCNSHECPSESVNLLFLL